MKPYEGLQRLRHPPKQMQLHQEPRDQRCKIEEQQTGVQKTTRHGKLKEQQEGMKLQASSLQASQRRREYLSSEQTARSNY